MGLGLEVGILADLKEADGEGFAYYKEQFGILSQVLSGAGLGTHVEPEELNEVFSCGMYGYGGIHYLRRVGAHLALGMPIPLPGDKEAAKDPVLQRDYWDGFIAGERLKYQHLIIHSDAEGFYVPIDFEGALVVPDIPLLGGMLGSTQQLRAECKELAGVLGVPAGMGPEADEIMNAIETQGQGREKWQQYAVETFTCLQLIAACEASLRTKAAIVFV
jgi:hypothetical protein